MLGTHRRFRKTSGALYQEPASFPLPKKGKTTLNWNPLPCSKKFYVFRHVETKSCLYSGLTLLIHGVVTTFFSEFMTVFAVSLWSPSIWDTHVLPSYKQPSLWVQTIDSLKSKKTLYPNASQNKPFQRRRNQVSLPLMIDQENAWLVFIVSLSSQVHWTSAQKKLNYKSQQICCERWKLQQLWKYRNFPVLDGETLVIIILRVWRCFQMGEWGVNR